MKNITSFLIPLSVSFLTIIGCTTADSSNPANQANTHVVCQGFSLTCQHGGTCGEASLGNNQYLDTCTCPNGYEGTYCESVIRDKFVGRWAGTSSNNYFYTGRQKQDTVYITPDTSIAKFDYSSNWPIGIPLLDTMDVTQPTSFHKAQGTSGLSQNFEGSFTDGGDSTLIITYTYPSSGDVDTFRGKRF